MFEVETSQFRPPSQGLLDERSNGFDFGQRRLRRLQLVFSILSAPECLTKFRDGDADGVVGFGRHELSAREVRTGQIEIHSRPHLTFVERLSLTDGCFAGPNHLGGYVTQTLRAQESIVRAFDLYRNVCFHGRNVAFRRIPKFPGLSKLMLDTAEIEYGLRHIEGIREIAVQRRGGQANQAEGVGGP